ncbi:MAG: hypothetical protein NZ922_00765 [Candidatus Methanomethyliaceae archaeon]|nr:hypothetical protein [Candidatus Methanomethyliaceae archaeon]MDW7970289.1 hypothetical protein [Nitrososphaerota archaeon]
MKVKLIVDNEEIQLNEFVNNIIGEIIVGAVKTLKGVNKDWKAISIEIKKN